MKLLSKIETWLSEEESGQGLVEYALIIVLVAVALILALQALQLQIDSKFHELAYKIQTAITNP